MMSRALLVVFTIFASLLLALASPVPDTNGTEVDLEKRINHIGRGTYFYTGLGNCGQVTKDSDPIVAIGKKLYDRNKGSNCNQWIRITDRKTGKTAYGRTVDSCPSCSDDDLDLSVSLFKKLAPLSDGVVNLEWNFKAKGWKP